MDITSVCIVCLSKKNLLPLGEFYQLYELLAGDNKFMGNELFTCSNCCALFSEVQELQKKIKSTQALIAHENDTKHIEETKLKLEIEIDYSSDQDLFNESLSLSQNNDIKPSQEKPSEASIKIENIESINPLESNGFNDTIIADPHVKIEPKAVKERRKRRDNRNYSIKEEWPNKKVIDFIKRYNFPFNSRYVRKLLNYRNMVYKTVCVQELFRDRFDLVVDIQHCADDDEVRELIMNSQKQRHYLRKKNKCNKCVIKFKCKQKLKEHIMENHAKTLGPLMCNICETRAATKEAMAEHKKTHYNKYVCKLCDHVECNKQQMWEHFKLKKKNAYQCPKCEVVFGIEGQFYRHYKAVHLHFICDYCNKSYYDRLWFEKHIIDQHMGQECKLCLKKFPTNFRLARHMIRMHCKEEQSELTYCVECNLHFKSRPAFQRHLYTARHKPAKKPTRQFCQECNLSFFSKLYLKKHINHVHLKKSIQCDICSKSFMDKPHLIIHIKSVHEKIKLPKDKICQYCQRGFTHSRILRHHIRTHTGEKPFECQLCDAAFAQKIALKTHVKAKHKDAAPEMWDLKPRLT